MCLIFLGYLINVYIDKQHTEKSVASKKEESLGSCTADYFTIKDLMWHKEDKDAPGIVVSITVLNNGDNDCKDIKGLMRFLSKDGAEIGKKDFIIHEYIGSKETKIFERIKVKHFRPSDIYDVAVTLEGAAVHQARKE